MNRLLRLFKKDRTWDFEGRCSTCRRALDLHLLVDPPNTITMRAAECPRHPGKAMILWPCRRDVIVSYGNKGEDPLLYKDPLLYSEQFQQESPGLDGPWSTCSPSPTPTADYDTED